MIPRNAYLDLVYLEVVVSFAFHCILAKSCMLDQLYIYCM